MLRNLLTVLVALLTSVILAASSIQTQDSSFLITLPATPPSQWAWQVDSAQPDALHFGMSVSAFPNQYAPAGDTSKDVVYQIGMNATGNGAARIDPAFGAITLNWESNWYNTNHERMSEWQVRAIGESGVRTPTDSGRVRFYHTEFTPSTTWMSNRIFGDFITIGRWNASNTIEIQNNRVKVLGGVGFWNSSGPTTKPTLDLSSPTLACDTAKVLASYGLVSTTGSC